MLAGFNDYRIRLTVANICLYLIDLIALQNICLDCHFYLAIGALARKCHHKNTGFLYKSDIAGIISFLVEEFLFWDNKSRIKALSCV
jgi:hypothetical protein